MSRAGNASRSPGSTLPAQGGHGGGESRTRRVGRDAEDWGTLPCPMPAGMKKAQPPRNSIWRSLAGPTRDAP